MNTVQGVTRRFRWLGIIVALVLLLSNGVSPAAAQSNKEFTVWFQYTNTSAAAVQVQVAYNVFMLPVGETYDFWCSQEEPGYPPYRIAWPQYPANTTVYPGDTLSCGVALTKVVLRGNQITGRVDVTTAPGGSVPLCQNSGGFIPFFGPLYSPTETQWIYSAGGWLGGSVGCTMPGTQNSPFLRVRLTAWT